MNLEELFFDLLFSPAILSTRFTTTKAYKSFYGRLREPRENEEEREMCVECAIEIDYYYFYLSLLVHLSGWFGLVWFGDD